MFTRRLALDGLLNEVEPDASAPEVKEGPRDPSASLRSHIAPLYP
jgi:hypothetical protein